MRNYKNNIGIKVIFFATFLLLASINLSAQNKLELEWQKQPGGVGFNISSIVTSSNDSLIYVAGGVYINSKSEYYIHTCKSTDGTVIRTDSAEAPYKMILSKDGKTLVAAGNYGVGLLDPLTFKRVYWNSEKASDYLSLNLNEKQSKFVICGSPTFIWIYDVESKQLFKEIKPKYSLSSNIILRNARLTDDGKYIIYSYVTDVQKFKNYITIMDIEGNIVKEFLETSSTNFTLTNDGKTLIYFMPDAIHFFDLVAIKESGEINFEGANPSGIEMSSDGKFMLLGFFETPKLSNSLIYFELETKQYYTLNDNSSWINFKLNNDNTNLIYGSSRYLLKFNITPNTSIIKVENKHEFKIQVSDNKLILTNPQNHQINTLTAYDILGRTYPLSANGNEVDVSVLAAGRYFLKVGLADGSFLDFGFLKE